ncbi:unnamed protein product [Cochlearia groenlandica]
MEIYIINDGEYELHNRSGGKFFVNLLGKSCSCMFWDKEMIPCPYAMAVGNRENLITESFICEKYYRGYLQHTWEESIYPFPISLAR